MSTHVVDELMGTGSMNGENGELKSELDRWIIRIKKVDNPRLRLFCLPYFAGGASIFNQWHEQLPEDIEVCAIQFPGREKRGDEKPYTDVNDLIKKMAEVMEPLLTTPVAFYSHSSGAWIALELVRYLRKHLEVHPVKFMVGGAKAAHIDSDFKFLKAIQADEVYKDKNIPNIKGHLKSLEIPNSILENDKVFNEMLPALRADILLSKNYIYYEDEPLNCPIIAFAGIDDSVFSEEQIRAWEKYTSSYFRFKWIESSSGSENVSSGVAASFCAVSKELSEESLAALISACVRAVSSVTGASNALKI